MTPPGSPALSPLRVRFAPSPTGLLHVGNARTAILNGLFARSCGGTMLLRLDDTDTARCRAEYAAGIEQDLRWLGLGWDAFARQSERGGRYEAAVQRLKDSGRLYPCFETEAELELKRKVQLSRGLPPIYDRAALRLDAAQVAEYQARGASPHWRFRLEDDAVSWQDLGRGAVHFAAGHLSDPVLMRGDGRPLYTLSSVVDDIELGVSHIIRGVDHVANSAVQIQLFAALGAEAPQMAHVPLMVGADGHSLSKRLHSLSLADVRAAGVLPRALVLYLAGLGRAHMWSPEAGLAELAAQFSFADYGRAAPRFDEAELARVNQRVLRTTGMDELHASLVAMGKDVTDMPSAEIWAMMRSHIHDLNEIGDWLAVYGAADWLAEDAVQGLEPAERRWLVQAAAQIPQTGFAHRDAYRDWVANIEQTSGQRGKALFRPLRLALTGRLKGPELGELVCHLPPDIIRKRLLHAK